MKYRTKTEILSEILDTAVEGAAQTRIMHRAYLSYSQLKEYLEILVANDLLTFSETSRTYHTTGKGQQFIKMNERMSELAPTVFTL